MKYCPKTVILSPSARLRINSAKDLPRVAYLGETLRQAQGDTLGRFESKPGFETEEEAIGYVEDTGDRHQK